MYLSLTQREDNLIVPSRCLHPWPPGGDITLSYIEDSLAGRPDGTICTTPHKVFSSCLKENSHLAYFDDSTCIKSSEKTLGRLL